MDAENEENDVVEEVYGPLRKAFRDTNEDGVLPDGSLTEEEVRKRGEYLHSYANHFERDMWRWTRNLGGLKQMRYDRPEDKLWGRIKQAVRWTFRRTRDWEKSLAPKGAFRAWKFHRIDMPMHALKRESHLPDGQFPEGPVYACWEEDGEYIQMVQPMVGSLVADFLMEEPENPHAQKIAKALREIAEDYAERNKHDETDDTDN